MFGAALALSMGKASALADDGVKINEANFPDERFGALQASVNEALASTVYNAKSDITFYAIWENTEPTPTPTPKTDILSDKTEEVRSLR